MKTNNKNYANIETFKRISLNAIDDCKRETLDHLVKLLNIRFSGSKNDHINLLGTVRHRISKQNADKLSHVLKLTRDEVKDIPVLSNTIKQKLLPILSSLNDELFSELGIEPSEHIKELDAEIMFLSFMEDMLKAINNDI
jgi:hypothetical protein